MSTRFSNLECSTLFRVFAVPLLSLGLLSSAPCASAQAEHVPLISGGGGFVTSTNGGNTSYIPTIVPVLAAPLGPNLLIESRATLLEDFFPKGGGQGYDHTHFVGVSYIQADYFATSHLTVVGGYFLTPFGTYSERLSPIWISNLQDAPIISPLGTMGNSVLGGQVRGSAYSSSHVSLDYAAYYSGRSSNEQIVSQHATGGRFEAYFPQQQLEIGYSYGRVLQGTHSNSNGFHVWWTPQKLPLRVRSQYSHGAHSQGYWIETDFRLSKSGGEGSVIGRLEPVFRMQQTFRNSAGGDGLPAQDTQRADFGLDYHLPHEVRINTSYARQFSASGNKNVWETGIVYRFLFPTWKGK